MSSKWFRIYENLSKDRYIYRLHHDHNSCHYGQHRRSSLVARHLQYVACSSSLVAARLSLVSVTFVFSRVRKLLKSCYVQKLDGQCLQSMFKFSRGQIQALLTLWPWPYKANPAVTSKHINIYTTRGWWKWREIFGWCEIWKNYWKSIESLFRIR